MKTTTTVKSSASVQPSMPMERDVALYRREPANSSHTALERVEAVYRHEPVISHDILFTYSFILKTYACFANVFHTYLYQQTYACLKVPVLFRKLVLFLRIDTFHICMFL